MPALDTWLWAAGIVCVFGSLVAVAIGIAVDSARRDRADEVPLPGDLGHGPWTTETPIRDELQAEYFRRAIDKHERGA